MKVTIGLLSVALALACIQPAHAAVPKGGAKIAKKVLVHRASTEVTIPGPPLRMIDPTLMNPVLTK